MSTYYTYDDVSSAVNKAADMLTGNGLDADAEAAINFVVNAALTVLKGAGDDIEDVLEANWDDSEDRDIIRGIVTGN